MASCGLTSRARRTRARQRGPQAEKDSCINLGHTGGGPMHSLPTPGFDERAGCGVRARVLGRAWLPRQEGQKEEEDKKREGEGERNSVLDFIFNVC